MRIAIVGGGAAGMVTAYLLNTYHHITVIEKQPILGGNIRTLNKNVTDVDLDAGITLDNGVIEFQRDTFVQFHKLMNKLGVHLADVDGGSTALFLADGRHISGPGVIKASALSWPQRIQAYLKLLPIWTSYQHFLRQTENPQVLVGKPIADFWRDDVWCIWQRMPLMYGYSIPYAKIDDFPAEIGAQILRQSGQGTSWTRVVGGVYTYIEKIVETFQGNIICNANIKTIIRQSNGVMITLASGDELHFDKLVFVMPPDQVLKLVADATPEEQRRFAAWQANKATTIIHTDLSMYQRYGVSFYSEFDLFEKEGGQDAGYNAYLNRLCGLPTTQSPHYSLAYNLAESIDPTKVVHRQD
ncbi:MAG: NAD(P)-binding protein, partial [Chloroflexota bacterium]